MNGSNFAENKDLKYRHHMYMHAHVHMEGLGAKPNQPVILLKQKFGQVKSLIRAKEGRPAHVGNVINGPSVKYSDT